MSIETHGLEPVPIKERTATWADMLIIWTGISLCLPSFVIGALLVPAFSWWEAVQINFWGNLLAGVLIVLGGYFGTKTGCPSVIYLRRVFGFPIGQWLPTGVLLVSTLGWFAVTTAITGLAFDEIIKSVSGFSSPMLITIVFGILNAATSIYGFHRMRWLNWLAVPLLSLFCIWISINIFFTASFPEVLNYQPTGTFSQGVGIDLVIGGFLTGALAASDFSRYTRDNRANWAGTLPGAFFVSFILGLLGSFAVAATGDWNPVLIVQDFGLGIPALVFILFANWTTNQSLLYSSGLALTNLLPGPGRWRNTLLCGAVGVALAVAGIVDILQEWLLFISYVISPIIGVILTDFFFISTRNINNSPINIPAVIAVATGITIAQIAPAQYVTSLVGLISSSVTYIGLAKLKDLSGLIYKNH